MTFVGVYSSLYFSYQRPDFDLSLGVLWQRDFGDEDEVSDAFALYRFRYRGDHFNLWAGSIDARGNHRLPDALVAEQYPILYPVEEGLQLLARTRNLEADVWVNWYLQNTPDHREFFAGGLYVQAGRTPFTAALGFRVTHHGGQLFSSGPVADNLSGMLRCTVTGTPCLLDTELGVTATLLGALDDPDRDGVDRKQEGYGVEGEVFVVPKGWRFYYSIFSGHAFRVEQGNPMYRTEKPFHRFGIRKTLALAPPIALRLKLEGAYIEADMEYSYSLFIDIALDILLKRLDLERHSSHVP
jgi:hypothetical protein